MMARVSHVVLLLCVFHAALSPRCAAISSECLDACTICSRTFSNPHTGRFFHPMTCSMGCEEELQEGYTHVTEWVLCREAVRELGLWNHR